MKVSIVTAIAMIGLLGGSMGFVDATYVRNSTFGDFQDDYRYGLALDIKREIRRLRREPQDQRTREDIAELVDKLCLLLPEDRECH